MNGGFFILPKIFQWDVFISWALGRIKKSNQSIILIVKGVIHFERTVIYYAYQ